MQPSFTRAEYWILETAVDCYWPLRCLSLPDRSLAEFCNKAGHGLERLALIETLDGLFGRGLVAAQRGEGPDLQLGRDEIVGALDEPRDVAQNTYYGLTMRGGSEWEAFACPNWNRYVLHDLDYEGGSGALTCGDRKWLEVYIERFSDGFRQVCWESLRWEEVGSWEATYWKSLPQGYRVHLRFSPESVPPYGDARADLAFIGYCSLRDNWYRWR